MEFPKTIGALFQRRSEASKKKNTIGWLEHGLLRFLTFEDYQKIIESLTLSFSQLGVGPHIKVSILSSTCKEWHFCDMAIMCAGGTVVPIYHLHATEEIEYIINHSESSFLIVENGLLFGKIASRLSYLKTLKGIICLNDSPSEIIKKIPKGIKIFAYSDLNNIGREGNSRFRELTLAQDGKSVASLIYSTGTDSPPNGSIITHEALVTTLFNIKSMSKGSFGPYDRNFAYLPLAHILGRISSLSHLIFEWETVFNQSGPYPLLELSLIQPTVFITVPQILEKIYSKIQAETGPTNILSKNLHSWGHRLTAQYHDKIQADLSPSPSGIILYNLYSKIFLRKIHQMLGGRIRFIISGGDSLNLSIHKFFRNMGFTILEGYGLTETIAPCTLNPLSKQIPGTVGIPIGDFEIQFTEENEIMVKSKALFSGYYKNPSKTKEVLKDGWFSTGDIGMLNPDGHLEIHGRKCDFIFTSNGMKINTRKIELIMKSQAHISHFMIAGEDRPFLIGIVGVEKDSFLSYFHKFGIPYHCSFQELIENPHIYDIIQKEIDEINTGLPHIERIKKFIIYPEELTIEGRHLSPKYRVRKKFILEKLADEILSLYQKE